MIRCDARSSCDFLPFICFASSRSANCSVSSAMLPATLPTAHVHKFVVFNHLQKPTPRSTASPRLPTRNQHKGHQLNADSRTLSKARPAERTNASLRNTLLETGGGEGGGINPPPTYTTEDGNGGFFEHNPLLEVLVKGGVALSELPLDLQVSSYTSPAGLTVV